MWISHRKRTKVPGSAQENFFFQPALTQRNTHGYIVLDKIEFDIQAVGVLPSKHQDETARPTWNCSYFLKNDERKYDTAKREFLAIEWSVLQLQTNLERTPSTIRRVSDWLKQILSHTKRTCRFARWHLQLYQLGFGKINCAGTKHKTADALCFHTATGENHILPVEKLLILTTKTSLDNYLSYRSKNISWDDTTR